MRYPKFLQENGTIGFVAPSFGCNIEPYRTAFLSAQEKLSGKGHRLVLGPNCYEGKGIGISNTPALCAKELTDAYCSRESDLLLSCAGGELMCEILDDVDWEKIKNAPPKWYMGYSDNTNFTFLLATLCDVASVYGPNAPAFGMEPWHPAIADAYELLRGRKLTMEGYDCWEKESLKDEENPCMPYHATQPRELRFFPEAGNAGEIRMEGRLLGGCMDCLVNLLGTQYDRVGDFIQRYREDGILWFLEACDLNVMAIRRAVWQMQHAGWFRQVKGFLIGRPLQYGQVLMGLDQYHAVYDLLQEYRVPVVMDVDLGHLPPMMPLICGAKAVVTGGANQLTVAMKCE